MKTAILVFLCSVSIAVAGGIVTKGNLHPRRMHDVVYYDNSFCFAVRAYGDARDNLQTIEPGLFVHSKAHGIWIQIANISTEGGRFGKNALQDERLMKACVVWDFTPLAKDALAELPLRTSGSICLPEKIGYDPETETFELGFLTAWEDVPGAATYLYIKRKDLLDAFNQHKQP